MERRRVTVQAVRLPFFAAEAGSLGAQAWSCEEQACSCGDQP
jgi:hypothetical protein